MTNDAERYTALKMGRIYARIEALESAVGEICTRMGFDPFVLANEGRRLRRSGCRTKRRGNVINLSGPEPAT